MLQESRALPLVATSCSLCKKDSENQLFGSLGRLKQVSLSADFVRGLWPAEGPCTSVAVYLAERSI